MQSGQLLHLISVRSTLAVEPAMQPLAVTPITPKFAGFWVRALAYSIDGLLLQLVSIVLVVLLALLTHGAGDRVTATLPRFEAYSITWLIGGGVMWAGNALLTWLWFTVAESSRWQATPGKKIVGIKVTDEYGERISFARANGRYWSKILSGLLLCIGFLMVAFSQKKQGLHDKIAGTLVVRAKH